MSRSSVMVKAKYQGHSFEKIAIAGAFLFNKDTLF